MSEGKTTLEVKNLVCGYGKKEILHNQSVSFLKPEIVSIIGPNGSGKSTLLKAIARLLKPQSGQVLLNGKDVFKQSPKQVAQKISLLPQHTVAPGDMTVERLVRIGRNPYKKFFKDLGEHDLKVVEAAMSATDVIQYRTMPVIGLSGGERQRVWLALSLAQEPNILLLDEPTTYLDSQHQLNLMKLVQRTYAKRGITIVMVLHDLNLALRYSHRIIALKDGHIVGDGSPKELMTEQNILDWFGVRSEIIWREYDGELRPVCIPFETE